MLGYRRNLTVIFGLWILCGTLFAAENVKDLYQAIEVVSADSNDAEINQAMSDGLASVVVRVSGTATSLLNPVIRQAMKDAKHYLSSFRYEKSTEIRTNLLGEVVQTKKLVMVFDVFRVKSLLTSGLVPVLDEMRPTVLAWIAIERTTRREILSELDLEGTLSSLEDTAAQRGVSYLLPAMDLIDQLSVNVSEVWGLFPDALLDASARYNSEYVLAGRLYANGDAGWKMDYVLLSRTASKRFLAMGATVDVVLEQVIDTIAETIATRYAVILGGNNRANTRFTVGGITSLSEYAQLQALLANIGQVAQVQVQSVKGDTLQLQISGYGNSQQLIDSLDLYRDQLRPLPVESRPEGSNPSDKWFHWQKKSQ